MLELIDGAVRSEGIIVVGATNRPGVIDPAIRRSGRLERHIEIPPPDMTALEGIFRHHLVQIWMGASECTQSWFQSGAISRREWPMLHVDRTGNNKRCPRALIGRQPFATWLLQPKA